MPTNKWYVDNSIIQSVVIRRARDEVPIAWMAVSSMLLDDKLELDKALDVAQQIVDDWNFSCDELEADESQTDRRPPM